MTVRGRYLLLLALRWFPVGLEAPILVLLPLHRGLSLAETGLAVSLQGFVVLAMELPTGGLADSWGRRPVLAGAAVVSLVSVYLFAVADSFVLLAVFAVLQGIYRALDSGPLDAWYVDSIQATDPEARLDKGLAAGNTMMGLAMGAGALVAGGLVAWVSIPGVDTLALPVWLGFAVLSVDLVAIIVLVREPPRPAAARRFVASLRQVPAVIIQSVGLVRRSRVLLTLVAVELCWGFGMVTFEVLMPARLSEEVGGQRAAAAITGPAGVVAWLAFAAGSALVPLLSARLGMAVTAGALRVAQGVAVLGMGLLAGPAGVLAGYLAAYLVHGGSNPVHQTLLHRQVGSEHRATVVSINSMVAQPAGSLGLILLTALATGTSTSTAIVLGAVVLAVAAPLYLPAARAERRAPASV